MTSEYKRDFLEHEHPVNVTGHNTDIATDAKRSGLGGAFMLAVTLWTAASAGAALAYDVDPLNPFEVAQAHASNF